MTMNTLGYKRHCRKGWDDFIGFAEKRPPAFISRESAKDQDSLNKRLVAQSRQMASGPSEPALAKGPKTQSTLSHSALIRSLCPKKAFVVLASPLIIATRFCTKRRCQISPNFNASKTVWLVLSPERENAITSLRSELIYTGCRSTPASTTRWHSSL